MGSDGKMVAGHLSISQLDLIRVIGHELKLPLSHIANTASMLADGDFTGVDIAEQHKQLEATSRRMILLVDSILFAGQVETNQLQLNLAPTNIASVAHHVTQELKYIARLYGKELKLIISQELTPAAVDPQAIRYALYGLIDTLIRTSESREIEILVHHQTDSIMVTLRSDGPNFSLSSIQEAIRRMGKASQPIKQLPNTTGMSFFVANTLTTAMQGTFLINQSSSKRNLSLRLPLSMQLELM